MSPDVNKCPLGVKVTCVREPLIYSKSVLFWGEPLKVRILGTPYMLLTHTAQLVALHLGQALGRGRSCRHLVKFLSLTSPMASTVCVPVAGRPVRRHSLHLSFTHSGTSDSSLC